MKITPSRLTAFAALSLWLTPAALAQDAAPIPDIAQALLNAAYESSNAAEVAAVSKAVKAVFPDYEYAIDAQSTAKIAEYAPAEEAAANEPEAVNAPPGGVFALSPWEGKIQAGASFTSGNSDNAAIGVAIDAARTAGDFVHNFTAYFDLAESNSVTSQKRWGGAYQLDYKFSERTYTFGRFSYDEDAFSGFDYRLFAGAGLGRFLYLSEPFTWKIEGGPGFRYSPIDLTREVEQAFALYGASETDWVIRNGVTFEQDFLVTWTAPTTTFQSITALTTSLTDSISTGISFEYRYETDPPAGRVRADTIARASVIYGF